MVVDVLAFLNARLDEQEKAARDAGGSLWHVRHEHTLSGRPCDCMVVEGRDILIYDEGGHDRFQAAHIARHSPETVLADVEAKRKLIDLLFEYTSKIDGEWSCSHTAEEIRTGECSDDYDYNLTGLYLLAAPFAAHPDYQTKWAT